MAESSLPVLLIAVGIDFIFLMLILVFFSVIKNMRSRKPELLPGEICPTPSFSETEYPLYELMRKVHRVTREQFLAFCKPEGLLYQDFTLYVIYLFAGLSLVGCFVLVPLYATRENSRSSETDLTNISQVSHNDQKSIAFCFLVLIVFSIVYYYFAVFFYRYASDAQIHSAIETSPIQDCCIMVTNLPLGLQPDRYNSDFFRIFNSVLPGGVTEAYILPDYEQMDHEYQRLVKLREKIAHYHAYEQARGQRAMIRVKFFTQQVDAINYYEEEEARCVARIKSHRVVGRAINCGYGFVICNSSATAKDIMAAFKTSVDKELGCAQWKLQPAPAPGDILWENMGSLPMLTTIKKAVLTLLFVLLFVIVLSPPAFLALIDEILDSLGLAELMEVMLSEYLPTLMIFLYQRVLIPEIIKFMAARERHLTNSAVMKSRLEKYLLFNTVFVFIVPFFGLQFIDFMMMFSNGDIEDWNRHFADRLTKTGQFFALYTVHLAFLSNGFDLLQIFRIVKLRIRLFGTINEREKMLAAKPDRFNFGYHYAMSLTALMIVLTFSVAFPLIIPVGLLYFVIKYFVHKYNMLCFYYIDQVTAGDIGRYALSYFFVFIFFFQVVTAGLLMLDGELAIIITGGIFLIISVIVFLWLMIFWEHFYGERKEQFSEADEAEAIILRKEAIEYRHPVDRDNSWEQPKCR